MQVACSKVEQISCTTQATAKVTNIYKKIAPNLQQGILAHVDHVAEANCRRCESHR